ncbi:MAG: MBL fold metallo-hydrolase, partial [Bacilli bacterium]|nr:MBL fold metallo-hydrolase [Bacilli bacterium]
MKVCILASGSSGNCTYIQVNNHNILIDAGICYKEIKEKLDSIDVKIEDIDTILVTHAHIDHTASLDKLYNKIHTNIYMNNDIYMEIKENILNLIYYKYLTDDLFIDDIHIKPFKTSHDTKDSKGYLIEYNNKSLVYITDTGYINNKYLK